MKTQTKCILTLVAALGMPLSAFAAGTIPTNEDLLFVQTAQRASLHSVAGKPGEYNLTMSSKRPFVTYITQRPHRKTGTISTKEFVQYWNKGKDSFSLDAPNADISATQIGVNGKSLNVPVELLNVSHDKNYRDLTYTFKILQGDKPANFKTLPSSMQLTNTALFIDGWCLSCIGN